jgi:hypothetical protein
MPDRKIGVSLSLRLYLVEHPGAALIRPIEEFSMYVRTTYYQTPGFMSEAIRDGPTGTGQADPETNKEDLNKEATS